MTNKRFLLTGDCHGKVFDRVSKILDVEESANLALIILGDAGLNFWLNKTDVKEKQRINVRIYCVRGNHEERPENLGYETIFDDDVMGEVYIDPINPEIRYFKDGGIYNIQGHSVLTLGGAYSVDKNYRLARAGLTEETNNPKKSGWFSDEQLTPEEMGEILENVSGKHFDFILSHTCPYEYRPIDLFLGCIDQSTVDNSMEHFLSAVAGSTDWDVWCFGHYHADRIEARGVQQFYYDIQPLDMVWNLLKRCDDIKTFVI